MPQFRLDLRWTPHGLANVANVPSEKSRIRGRAKAEAEAPDTHVTIISITDRPDIGPIWIVEGEESKVQKLAAKFRGEGNVTVDVSRT